METFENKKVPFFQGLYDNLTKDTSQTELCDSANCDNLNIDCGECLFANNFCDKATFEQWKHQKLDIINGQ